MYFAKRLVIGLLMSLLSAHLFAQTVTKPQIEALQTEMYRLFYLEDSLKFRQVVQQLKDACEQAGEEQVFYRAWGNYSIYESTHQRRTQALAVAREMEDYAEKHKSVFGTYTAIHVMGTVYHQMRDYDNAEKTFLKAIDYLHKNSPGTSAAADYIELLLISVNGHKNVEEGKAYAQKGLEEPGISAQHRMRILTMLCEIEGEQENPDREKFNSYYEERLQAKVGTSADRSEAMVNLLYHFVNGNYERALVFADSLSTPDQIAYSKARIYHKLGDNARAYGQMLVYKATSDSMHLQERTGLLSEYITQLSNERLELEKRELQEQNTLLTAAIISILVLLFIALLIWIIWRRVKLTRRLRHDNAQLGQAHQKEVEARIAEHHERKEVEKQLDVKREYLNNIAQEIRASLNPISGFSDILSTTEFELGQDERQMMSEHIKENSKMITEIIDHMLELSFYESKTSLPKDDVFSPNIACQNAIDYTKDLIGDSGIEVNFRTELPDSLTVKSDLVAVGKVLRQLLNNAVKFTKEGGVLLNCLENEGQIRFMVTDTGPGIDPERQAHIFEPLVQTGDRVKATGMGLAICKCISKLLGGTISLDTSYKKGSRFIFEIPKE